MGKYNLLIIIFTFSGCAFLGVPREITKNFTYCYDENQVGIDSLINIKGYYMLYKPSKKTNYRGYSVVNIVPDTTRWYCIFFSDGMFIYSNNKMFESDWGRFVISGDTIKTQFVELPGGQSWLKGEAWFKVIDRSTIKQLCIKIDGIITNKDVEEYKSNEQKKNISLAKFKPLIALPDPDKCWLKKEKWFWCDKEKYEAWKHKGNKVN